MWSRVSRGVLTTICSPGPRNMGCFRPSWSCFGPFQGIPGVIDVNVNVESTGKEMDECGRNNAMFTPVITISIGGIGPIRWYGYHFLVVYGIVFQISQNQETGWPRKGPKVLVAVDVKGVYYQAVTLMGFWRNWNSVIKVVAVHFVAFARNSRCEKLLKVCRTVQICCPLLNCHEEWVELGLNGPESNCIGKALFFIFFSFFQSNKCYFLQMRILQQVPNHSARFSHVQFWVTSCCRPSCCSSRDRCSSWTWASHRCVFWSVVTWD